MADRPLEVELMMTTYSQMGQDLSDNIDYLDAFVPSGVEENELGFDMQIPNLKGVVFQFKRPKEGNPRRFGVRYSTQDPPRQLDRMKNWALKFGDIAAFYALPLVVDHANLGDTLQRTAFVPASQIDKCASIIRIPENYVVDGRRVGTSPVKVYCSQPSVPANYWLTTIPSSAIRGWKDLKAEIGNCGAGFRIRWENGSCFEEYHDDHRWYPRPEDDTEFSYDEFVDSRPDWFVEPQSPLLTRVGTTDSFGW